MQIDYSEWCYILYDKDSFQTYMTDFLQRNTMEINYLDLELWFLTQQKLISTSRRVKNYHKWSDRRSSVHGALTQLSEAGESNNKDLCWVHTKRLFKSNKILKCERPHT